MKELYNACIRMPADIAEIQSLLDAKHYSPAELAEVFISYIEDNCKSEALYFYDRTGRFPRKEEVHSGLLFELANIFLVHGMDPNYVKGESCPFAAAGDVDFEYVGADTVRLLMEHGGDPHLRNEEESIFEEFDFDIVTVAREFFCGEEEMPAPAIRNFNAKIHAWFVMIGYGGLIAGGKTPVTMKEGYPIEILREHERFDFSIGLNLEASYGWEILIFERATGELVAWL